MRLVLSGFRLAVAACAAASAVYLLGLDAATAHLSGGVITAGAFCTTLLAFAAAPRSRRDDLVMGVGTLFATSVCLRTVFQGGELSAPLGWAALGVLAAWAPGKVERLRSRMRREMVVPFRRASDFRGRRLITTGA